MEAHFPRKELAMHKGSFTVGSVACSSELPYASQKCIGSKNFNLLSIVQSSSHYCPYLFRYEHGLGVPQCLCQRLHCFDLLRTLHGVYYYGLSLTQKCLVQLPSA